MFGFSSVDIYGILVFIVVLATIGMSCVFPSQKDTAEKFMPYESGIKTETHLLQKRFPLRHYLVGLMFLIFDVEVVFMYPWAVVAKSIGPFAFFEMFAFLAVLLVGFAYVWSKGGLQWE